MLMSLLLLAAFETHAAPPPVPGLCTAPVPADRDTPGCYQTNIVELGEDFDTLYWHIFEFQNEAAAAAEAKKHRLAAVTTIHGRTWLYVLGVEKEAVEGGVERAVIGPLDVPEGNVTAHFSEAIFPPGMRTRVHSHPGPEAFYVVEGEQCMETPTEKQKLAAGTSYIVRAGPHLQAAPRGRRNLVLILAPSGKPFVIPGGDWTPTGFCDG